ncbi:phospholipase D-like domain-containing protein [Streptomyces macrosporus]|uniref:phospholipase D n=1 Tax=Streptomyces macrosporus TaxID=44032 RepID=A0ABP5WD54_9ACTN
MTRRIVTTALLLGALLMPAGTATAAEEAAAPVATGAVFNDPRGTTAEKNAVKNHIIGAINATESGRTIRAALYALTDQDYADALIAAHDRGIQVRVVLDSTYADRPAAQSVRAALGGDTSGGSWVRVCTAGRACIADAPADVNPINHNKFFTFSRIGSAGEAEDVVIQTSANQTSLNVEKYWNNAYTVVGNTDLYSAYVAYFNDLAAMQKDGDYFRQGKVGAAKYYFFPQATGDLVVDVLDNVTCTGNTSVGSDSHKTVIRVGAFALHRDAVARKLRALADQDCWVEVVYADSNDVGIMQGHPRLKLYRLNTADGYLVHSKYLTIEGNYAGHPDTKWTFTGSHNLDHSSLRENDEALLRLEGAAPHDAYRRNFLDMRAAATPVG